MVQSVYSVIEKAGLGSMVVSLSAGRSATCLSNICALLTTACMAKADPQVVLLQSHG